MLAPAKIFCAVLDNMRDYIDTFSPGIPEKINTTTEISLAPNIFIPYILIREVKEIIRKKSDCASR